MSSFAGTRLVWHKTQPCLVERGHGVGVARAAKAAKVAVDKSCQVGEHVLDNFSNYLFHQIQRPFAKYIPDDWDPLDFLPVNIQSSLQKSEALVSPGIHPDLKTEIIRNQQAQIAIMMHFRLLVFRATVSRSILTRSNVECDLIVLF